MDILARGAEENSYNILPSAATMLFHGLPGGDVHGTVDEMDRRGKSESVAISSVIDMGESETVRTRFCLPAATESSTAAAAARNSIIIIVLFVLLILAQSCIKREPFSRSVNSFLSKMSMGNCCV